jgi:hypothetical protein
VAHTDPKSASTVANPVWSSGIPGSASSPHPTDAIPLPDHGFATLDEVAVPELAEIPAAEVITRAAVMLMSASAQKLGLAAEGEPRVDLDEARLLITALAGLLAASRDSLGTPGLPLVEGLKTLQNGFRETSSRPDAPGAGPGEALVH